MHSVCGKTLVNQILPNAMIVLFNVLLLVRILWQKYRLHQAMQWRKHRKMTIQLLSISLLYLIFACPNTLFLFMYLCGLPDTAGSDFKRWAEVFSYYLMLLFPFVCIFSQPETSSANKENLSTMTAHMSRLNLFRSQRRTSTQQLCTVEDNHRVTKTMEQLFDT